MVGQDMGKTALMFCGFEYGTGVQACPWLMQIMNFYENLGANLPYSRTFYHNCRIEFSFETA
jgi:hypothetical protein